MYDILDKVRGKGADPLASKNLTLGNLISIVLNVILGVTIAISTIAIMASGVQYVMSQGDPKAIDTARNYLTYSIIGFIFAIGAFALKTIILNLLGVTDANLKNTVPNF